MAEVKQLKIDTMTPAENAWFQAYADLEGDLCDLITMARICAEKSIDGDDGEKCFTATHLCDLLEDFQDRWREGYKQARGD